MKDYYKILQVGPEAKPGDIKRAYRALCKKWHPDANEGSKEAEEQFKRLVEAYKILSDRAARRLYDAQQEQKAEEIRRNSWWGKLKRLFEAEDEGEVDLLPRYAVILKVTGFFLFFVAFIGMLNGIISTFGAQSPADFDSGVAVFKAFFALAFFLAATYFLGDSWITEGMGLNRIEIFILGIFLTVVLQQAALQGDIVDRGFRKFARELGLAPTNPGKPSSPTPFKKP